MVQWLEIRLPMQGTQVSSLIQEGLHMPRGPCSTTREGTTMTCPRSATRG